MVCVVICTTYINDESQHRSDEDVDSLRDEIETVFRINCSNCRSYK